MILICDRCKKEFDLTRISHTLYPRNEKCIYSLHWICPDCENFNELEVVTSITKKDKENIK